MDTADTGGGDPEGGDDACWAHRVCPECGAMVEPSDLPGRSMPHVHRPG
ncbi:MAG: hypothetical protein WAL61_12805 [Acidimicrobiales bacterium]